MKRLLVAMASMTAMFLGGCADDLTPIQNDRPPAPYAPDPESHLPQPAGESGNTRI
ncbi:MAG: hypothetical protein ACXWGY_06300 [Chthoniobacterales bacterium]